MGGQDFTEYVEGDDPQEAFEKAVKQAQWEYGHGGYTGTIAEKASDGFTVVTRTPMPMTEAQALINRIFRDDDRRYTDKWGACGAIPIKTDTRTVRVDGLTGTVPRLHDDAQQFTATVAEAARERGLLRDGEEPVRAQLRQYEAGTTTHSFGGYGTRSYRPSSTRFTDGVAELTVKRTAEDLAAQTNPDGWLFFGVASS